MSKIGDMLRSVGILGPIKATAGTAVTGVDNAAIIRSCAKQIYEQAERGAQRLREQDARWKYEERETYVCLAKRISPAKASARPYYEVKMVSNVPGLEEPAWGRGWTIAGAEIDLRFRLARMYVDGRIVRDFDEARERASKVTLLTERSTVLGTGGVE